MSETGIGRVVSSNLWWINLSESLDASNICVLAVLCEEASALVRLVLGRQASVVLCIVGLVRNVLVVASNDLFVLFVAALSTLKS